jgi:hypothetical protein
MKTDSSKIPFGKTFLTALFSGILATGVCFVFEIWYRMKTFYGPSDFINVASIIFIVNLLLLLAGVAYFACKTWFRKGDLIYLISSLLISFFCISEIAKIRLFKDLKLNHEFIQLLGGITIVIGLAALCIPYFYNNRKINNLFYEADV